MKNFTYSNSSVAIYCLCMCFFMITACQPEESTQRNGNANLDQTNLRTGDCELDCIVPGGPYFETTDSKVIQWGGRYGNANSKTVDIAYYNTETHFVIMAKSTSGWSDLVINGLSVWTNGPVTANTWGTYSYPLDEGWQACDLESFALAVSGNGPPADFTINYNLIGTCPEGCETEFRGEAVSCDNTREAIYTFTADSDQDYIKIQGGLTNFTGEDAIVTVTGGNCTTFQSTPGGSSNRIIKIEGNVSECEEITIHITWNSTNSGGIITGGWSVKDENGTELAPSLNGLECN
ncbi:hypothetical protein ABGT15_03990 [Flavobacterium enshiense]|uniref:hypothetical protein n=1 Tax=Flavobacterium enshiense TaxID=1341165 RepID=UPI00345D04F1